MRKSFTLVEVMVALAVFARVIVGITTTVVFINKIEKRSEYFSHFETICLDIDKYSDEYGKEWDLHYYGEKKDAGIIYYSDSYEIVGSEEASKFTLSYSYNTSGQLIINVSEKGKSKKIIDNLNYGGRRYAS